MSDRPRLGIVRHIGLPDQVGRAAVGRLTSTTIFAEWRQRINEEAQAKCLVPTRSVEKTQPKLKAKKKTRVKIKVEKEIVNRESLLSGKNLKRGLAG